MPTVKLGRDGIKATGFNLDPGFRHISENHVTGAANGVCAVEPRTKEQGIPVEWLFSGSVKDRSQIAGFACFGLWVLLPTGWDGCGDKLDALQGCHGTLQQNDIARPVTNGNQFSVLNFPITGNDLPVISQSRAVEIVVEILLPIFHDREFARSF